jgi:hypothetical protein
VGWGNPLRLRPYGLLRGAATAKNGIARCLPVTLAYEGEWSNDIHDPGGQTMKGGRDAGSQRRRHASARP